MASASSTDAITTGRRAEQFWAKVTKSEGCWMWTGAQNLQGYGSFNRRGGGESLAHRFSFVEANGSVPSGLIVMHICDTPLCVRPDHLRLGTKAANSRDMVEKGRSTRGERNPNARLTDDRVREIRARSYSGEEVASIAATWGISPHTVKHVLTGYTWRHVA